MASSSSKTTTDHKEIQKWVESRGGKPSTVRRTGNSEEQGVLRIDFPGYTGSDTLEEISWDDFFQKFDENNLAFLYQEETSKGEESHFFKLISRETAEHKTEHKVEHKTEHKAEHKAEHKTEHKTEHKAAHKTEHKAAHK